MNVKILGALGALALLAACSSDDAANSGAATGAGGSGGVGGLGGAGMGAARPGSQEDLVANVGDRVFFDTDSSQVRGDGRTTLERQAAWLDVADAAALGWLCRWCHFHPHRKF